MENEEKMSKKLIINGDIFSEEEIFEPVRNPDAIIQPGYVKFVADRYDECLRAEMKERKEKMNNSNLISKLFDKLDNQIGGKK